MTLGTSGTLADMGYHTVTLPSPVGIASGQEFTVAVKVTSPGVTSPIAVEAPAIANGYAHYSSAATAQPGQSWVSSGASSPFWSNLTAIIPNANVCLKAYTEASAAPAPTVTGFTPTSGPAGTSVTLTGSGLAGATAVAFNGTAAIFSVVSDTQITAMVFPGATSGPIAVTTPRGIATSAASIHRHSGTEARDHQAVAHSRQARRDCHHHRQRLRCKSRHQLRQVRGDEVLQVHCMEQDTHQVQGARQGRVRLADGQGDDHGGHQ